VGPGVSILVCSSLGGRSLTSLCKEKGGLLGNESTGHLPSRDPELQVLTTQLSEATYGPYPSAQLLCVYVRSQPSLQATSVRKKPSLSQKKKRETVPSLQGLWRDPWTGPVGLRGNFCIERSLCMACAAFQGPRRAGAETGTHVLGVSQGSWGARPGVSVHPRREWPREKVVARLGPCPVALQVHAISILLKTG
jgi:hypothetical protein